jgi:hypothetical protein
LDLVVETNFLHACSVLSGMWCELDVGLFYCFIEDDYDIGNGNNHKVSIELLTATHNGKRL